MSLVSCGIPAAAAQYGGDRFFVKDALNWDEVAAFVNSVDKS